MRLIQSVPSKKAEPFKLWLAKVGNERLDETVDPPKGIDRTEFYAHDQNWTNRMILGDSLQVMGSLAEREGLRGKVQCISNR